MKEIDFIPQWYRDGQKQKVNYRTQCVVVICIFVAIVFWSFGTCYSVSRAKAQINRIQESLAANADLAAEFSQLTTAMAELREKAEILDKLDHKTSIANVIGELSFLVTDNIILKKVDVSLERFTTGAVSANKSRVRLLKSGNDAAGAIPQEDTRFKVAITGVGAGVEDVAALISQLENSSYFCQVVPGFSRAGKVKDFIVTEFEISCYLANYEQQK
jgi:LEA14-like dessication related protein